MYKRDLISGIMAQVSQVHCFVARVYGVSHGVGYDLNVDVSLKDGRWLNLAAHAVKSRCSWDCVGHLRPDNPYYQYTGSCDYYQQDVVEYWESKKGLKGYLERLTKVALQELYNTYC